MSSLASKSLLESLSLVPVEGGYYELKKEEREPKTEIKAARASLSRALGGRRLAPVRTKMYYTATITSGAATAISTQKILAPSDFNEFSTFQALYNEMKVHGGVVHFSLATPTSSSATGKCLMGIVGYTPTDATAVTASAGLSLSQRLLYFTYDRLDDGWKSQTRNRNGALQMRFKVPDSTQSADDLNIVTGTWAEVATSLNYGSILFSQEAGGTDAVTSIKYVIELDISFRSRQ